MTVKRPRLANVLAWLELFLPAVMLASFPAAAQTFNYVRQNFSKQISFGDSLSDPGNVSYVTSGGSPPQSPAAPPPPMGSDAGRYSNGLMWPELIAGSFTVSAPGWLGQSVPSATGIGFAYGGSTSGNSALDLTTETVPGAITQVQEYLSLASSGVVPRVSPTTLFTLFTGANDYIGYISGLVGQPQPGVVALQGQVSLVQTNIATSIKLLAGAGARTVLVVNQFDLGLVPLVRTPAVYGESSALPIYAATIGTQLTNINNAEMAGFLRQLQAQTGVRLIQVDVNALYRDAFNNPWVYGLTNVTSSCVGTDFATAPPGGPACSTAAQAAQVMFWEATHPGFTIQNLIAELMNGTLQTVLSGPQTIAVQSQLGMAAAESRREIAAERLAKTEEEGFRPFVESGYSGGTARATSDRSGFTYGQSLYAFGGEYRFDPATFVGSYFSYAGNNADLSNNAGSVGLETYGLDVYAGFRTNGWNGLAQFGAIRDDFNKISRASGYAFAPTASASTTGWTEQLNAEGGYAWPLGGPLEGLSVGPYGGLDVTRIDIAGYQESGTRLLNLAVQGRGVTSVVGSLGVQLNGTLNANGILFKPRADIAFERELGFDTDSVVASLSDGQTATVNAGPGARDAFRLRLGCDVILGQGLTAGASYSQIVTRDGNSNYGGRVDIAYHF